MAAEPLRSFRREITLPFVSRSIRCDPHKADYIEEIAQPTRYLKVCWPFLQVSFCAERIQVGEATIWQISATPRLRLRGQVSDSQIA